MNQEIYDNYSKELDCIISDLKTVSHLGREAVTAIHTYHGINKSHIRAVNLLIVALDRLSKLTE